MKEYDDLENFEFENATVENISTFSKIVKTFTAPTEAFKVIKTHKNILFVYLIYILASAGMLFLQFADGSMKELIIEQLVTGGTEITDQVIQLGLIMGVVFSGLIIAIMPLVGALIYHVICMLMGKTGFGKTLTVILHAMLIPIAGSIIIYIVKATADIDLLFSPLMFLDVTTMSAIAISLLSLIDVFTIWYMVVLFIGFKIVHELSQKEAIILIAVPFALKVGFAVVATMLAEAATTLV